MQFYNNDLNWNIERILEAEEPSIELSEIEYEEGFTGTTLYALLVNEEDLYYYQHPFEREHDYKLFKQKLMSKQVEQKPGICPCCNTNSLRYKPHHEDEMTDDNTEIGFKWVCDECDSEGIEWSRIDFTCHDVKVDHSITDPRVADKTKISPEQLKTLLNKNVPVVFYYFKINGDLRKTIGTRSHDIIPFVNQPKGVKKDSPKTVNYYDYEAEGWRSVSTNSKIYI